MTIQLYYVNTMQFTTTWPPCKELLSEGWKDRAGHTKGKDIKDNCTDKYRTESHIHHASHPCKLMQCWFERDKAAISVTPQTNITSADTEIAVM